MNARELEDRRRGSPSGEEELRFIRNFHDVFLSIGLVMFGFGLGLVSMLIVGQSLSFDNFASFQRAGWTMAGVLFIDAVIMWVIAEFFARTRRLFLPAIVILIGFAGFFAGGVIIAYVTMFSEGDYSSFREASQQLKLLPLTVSASVTIAVFAYYLRMKLPFAMGVGGVMLTVTAIAYLGYADPMLLSALGGRLQLFAGLFLFALGVFFDARDPERKTRISDNGFWLHFFAAPLIFNAVMTMTIGGGLFARQLRGNSFGAQEAPTDLAALTLGLVLVFALVSLLINRRALLVAGLISAAASIAILLRGAGLGGAWVAAMTLLLLGGAMVLLGGGWHSVRRMLVAPFPKTGLIARIIPPEPDRDEADAAAE